MRTKAENKAAILDFLNDWTLSTERMIGAKLKKLDVKVTNKSQKNIRIKIIDSLASNISIEIYFRNSLRYTDMGAGNGYHLGVKVGRVTDTEKGRKRKRIINKPLFGRIERLKEGIISSVITDFINDLSTPQK